MGCGGLNGKSVGLNSERGGKESSLVVKKNSTW